MRACVLLALLAACGPPISANLLTVTVDATGSLPAVDSLYVTATNAGTSWGPAEERFSVPADIPPERLIRLALPPGRTGPVRVLVEAMRGGRMIARASADGTLESGAVRVVLPGVVAGEVGEVADMGAPDMGASADLSTHDLAAPDLATAPDLASKPDLVAPRCDDGVKNGTETDKDCGGSCPACNVGGACLGAKDCISKVCANNVCEPISCSDGVQNGLETDIDCGGNETCPKCPPGKMCNTDVDCATWCTMHTCAVAPDMK